MRDGHYAWSQPHALPLTKVDQAAATAECSVCQKQRPMVPNMAPFPRVTSQRPGGKLIKWDPFYHGRSSVLFLPEEVLTLDMDLHSLHAVLLPKLSYVGLQNYLSTVMVFYVTMLVLLIKLVTL